MSAREPDISASGRSTRLFETFEKHGVADTNYS
jgi:hypothetical protein